MSEKPQSTNANRTAAGKFTKGTSGNPGGRPQGKGLANLVREQTKDGAELIQIMLTIARNEDAKDADRIRAVEYLSDRGFGKVAQPLTGEDGEGAAIIVKWGGRGDGDSAAT